MWVFFTKLFNDDDFMPRWKCGNWSDFHGWLHIVSDVLTWAAYTAIPIVLATYIIRRRDVYFPFVFWLFCAFILSCGTVHLVEATIFWIPVYRFSGFLKAITAIASWATVIALIRVAPAALKLPLLREEITEKEKIETNLRSQLQITSLFATVAHIANLVGTKQKLFRQSAQAIIKYTELEIVRFWKRDYDRDIFELCAVESNHPCELVVQAQIPAVQFVELTEQGKTVAPIFTNEAEMLDGYTAFAIMRDANTLGGFIEIFDKRPIDDSKVESLSPTIDVLKQGYFRLLAERVQSDLISELQIRNREIAERNQELDEFTYVASHDLRAPLRAIDSLSQMICEDEAEALSDDGKYKFELMMSRVERMNKLLDDLLAFSRIGRKKDPPEMVDSGRLVQETIELLGVARNAKIQVAENMPVFECSRTPLAQVFRNLIDNAIKHHDKDLPNIDISCREMDEFYEFCIADDGPGIAPAHHKKIFKMFETLRPRDEVEGSGMGLALIKKFANFAGGDIRVESTPSKGSRFFVTWPKTAQ